MRVHAFAAAALVGASAIASSVSCGEELPFAAASDAAVDVGDDVTSDAAPEATSIDADADAECTTAPCNVDEVAIGAPTMIAASINVLVWVTGAAVLKLEPGKGPITQMTPETGGIPSGYVTADPSLVLMTNANGVKRCPINTVCGTNPSNPIYGLSDPGPIAIGGSEMYTAERASTFRVVTCGLTTNCDNSPSVVAYLPAAASRLALTTSSVVVGLADQTVRAYVRTSRLEAGAPVPAPLATVTDLRGLATDGPDVYWADGIGGAIGTCNVDSCAATKRALVSQRAYPRSVAVNAGGLYWVETNANAVLRCSLPDCKDATVIARVSRPSDLALGDRVYVVSESEQKIYATALR
jgi:hypothetical protein